MKYAIPEISWHNRDPVLSVDFQPKCAAGDPLRLATGGTDTHVLIWYIATTNSGSVDLEVAADLTRHQKAVNVVRWSPSGEYLASGDDESIIFIWRQKTEEALPVDGEEQYKESWVIHKTLRGHVEDVLDLSWSVNSLQLASGSVDNKLLLWDVTRGRYSNILADHKGFVQGVAWDPRSQFVATASSDRVFRTFDIATKKVVSRSSKAVLPFPSNHPLHNATVRLYHDDTLQTYYRRLSFSPDGLLIAVPAGRIEPEQGKMEAKPMNAVYIYTRYSLKVPVCVLPCGECALVTRWSPKQYSLRPEGPKPAFPADRRLILAIATKRSVLLYDTQQKTPIAMISNIHYTRLTDLTWSPDGRTLVASSTDGFCSVITFSGNELGEILEPASIPPDAADEPMDTTEEQADQKDKPDESKTKTDQKEKPDELKPKADQKDKLDEPKLSFNKIDSFIQFRAPEKKQKSDPVKKTPVKMDVMVETAMPSWSDNSNSDVVNSAVKDQKPIEIMEIEDSEDLQLVYEDTCKSESDSQDKQTPEKKEKMPENKEKLPENKEKTPEKQEKTSPKQVSTPSTNFFRQAKVTDVKEPAKSVPSPKAPRRVSFVTLSSPKNKKKC